MYGIQYTHNEQVKTVIKLIGNIDLKLQIQYFILKSSRLWSSIEDAHTLFYTISLTLIVAEFFFRMEFT